MKRLLLIATLALALVACSAAQQAKVDAFKTKALADIQLVASGVLAAADAGCKDLVPILRLASGLTSDKTVATLSAYGASICSPAGTIAPGSIVTASTAAWIGGVKTALQVAAHLSPPATVDAPAAPATVVSVPPTSAPAAAPVAVSVPAVAAPSP